MKTPSFQRAGTFPKHGFLTLAALFAAALASPLDAGTSGRALYGCGANLHGELCDGSGSYYYANTLMRDDVVKATTGYSHSLYIDAKGDLYACGTNDQGELGNGTTSTYSLTPVFVAHHVRDIACGTYSSFFVTDDGNLYSFGYNYSGQLGTTDKVNQLSPVHVADNVAAIATGDYDLLVLDKSGNLRGIGRNQSGQLGVHDDLNDLDSWQPIATGVTKIASGNDTTLYLTTGGTLVGFGYNTYGELGVTTQFTYTTDRITVATNVRDFCASGQAVFYIDNNDDLYGIGYNNSNYWGVGSDVVFTTAPVLIMSNVLKVSSDAGSCHILAVTKDHKLHAIGNNSDYQTGHTGSTVFDTWAEIDTNVVDVCAKWNRSLYIKATGVSCYADCGKKGLKSAAPGWVDDTYFPWVWSYALGTWYYVYDGICADTSSGYWIFYYTPDFTGYGWGYLYPETGWWCFGSDGSANWLYYGEKLP